MDRLERADQYPKAVSRRRAAQAAVEIGNLLLLRIGARHERMAADSCEEALAAMSAITGHGCVVPLE